MAADVKIFAQDLEKSAQQQIARLAELPPYDGATIRIMPDAHAGAGCVVGFTANVTDHVIPNVIGVDIGCGLLAVRLDEKADEALARKLDACAHERVPVGMEVHETPTLDKSRLSELSCSADLKAHDRLVRSLGTLGGGNHFIECDVDPDGAPWLVIHTGSRNIGKQVAEIYQALAAARHRGNSKSDREELIARLKEEGREREIASALADLVRKASDNEQTTPDDLWWLSGSDKDDYLHDMGICQALAHENRWRIVEQLKSGGIRVTDDVVSSVHNYIDLENGVSRKGAIAAYEGQRLIIPLNMAAGCVIGTGRGNADWNNSAPHGAGRRMSRGAARRELVMEEYRHMMEGVFSTTVCEQTIDEAPQAYKDPRTIVDSLGPTVDVDFVMRPIWNFKATQDKPVWKRK
ncbi:MAG: RtcB family protein [Atopobiaceae bacterium]|nr:RtcB family protein [Atopobiaceae bacterium]